MLGSIGVGNDVILGYMVRYLAPTHAQTGERNSPDDTSDIMMSYLTVGMAIGINLCFSSYLFFKFSSSLAATSFAEPIGVSWNPFVCRLKGFFTVLSNSSTGDSS